MKNHLTRLTLIPTSNCFGCGTNKQQSLSGRVYNWSYQFSNGSRLVGKIRGEMSPDGNTLVKPIEIKADYLAQDGETVLQSWITEDFACFESSCDGTNLLIVASNDNFVGNSMCLVESPGRKRAQVSNEGQPLISETLHQEAWELKPETIQVNIPAWQLDYRIIPLFPFVAVNLNLRLFDSQKAYQWALFPWFCPLPFVRLAASAATP